MKPIEKIFPGHTEKIERGECTTCGIKIDIFRNEFSVKEWKISGMCQKCQDSVFGED